MECEFKFENSQTGKAETEPLLICVGKKGEQICAMHYFHIGFLLRSSNPSSYRWSHIQEDMLDLVLQVKFGRLMDNKKIYSLLTVSNMDLHFQYKKTIFNTKKLWNLSLSLSEEINKSSFIL